MTDFSDLKVGDRVNRRTGYNGHLMLMEVVGVGNDLIECAAVHDGKTLLRLGWTFDRKTGAEIDDDLKWGPKYGVTGTQLEKL
jgi:hypothetical protein